MILQNRSIENIRIMKRLIALFAGLVTVIACLVFSLLHPINCDVAWGLTMSEKLLDGQRLYIDILETNPPMTIWLHMPAVALSRATGLSADSLQILLTFLFLVTCLGLSRRILAKARLGRLAFAFTLSGAVALTLPWLATISEREHWALAALTPIIAIQIVHCTRRNTSLRLRMIAGGLAGLAVAIKPVFALCVVAPALYTAWRTRSIQGLFRKEYWIAAGVNLIYLGSVFWCYPTYRTQMLPGLLDTYFRVRVAFISLASPDLILSLLAIAAFFVREIEPKEAVDLVLIENPFGRTVEIAGGPRGGLGAGRFGCRNLDWIFGFVGHDMFDRWRRPSVTAASVDQHLLDKDGVGL